MGKAGLDRSTANGRPQGRKGPAKAARLRPGSYGEPRVLRTSVGNNAGLRDEAPGAGGGDARSG